MAIKNSVPNDICSKYVNSINVFDCCLSSVFSNGGIQNELCLDK